MRTTTIKHIVTLPLIVLGMGIFTSCEDFLSEKKYDFIDEADFYTNNTELELAVNGAYEVLSEKMTYGTFYARQRLRYRPEPYQGFGYRTSCTRHWPL